MAEKPERVMDLGTAQEAARSAPRTRNPLLDFAGYEPQAAAGTQAGSSTATVRARDRSHRAEDILDELEGEETTEAAWPASLLEFIAHDHDDPPPGLHFLPSKDA